MSRSRSNANPPSAWQVAVRWVIDILVVIVLAIFLVQMMGERVRVEGHSMEPALAAGDEVLIDKIRYHFFPVKRFDVVLFRSKDAGDEKYYIKRVVGLPGEKLQIRDGKIYVNDVLLETGDVMSYYTVAGLAEEPVTLKENEYFLVGDNGDSSEDSRFVLVGNVQQEQIIGKVWLRVSPFQNLGFIQKVEESK